MKIDDKIFSIISKIMNMKSSFGMSKQNVQITGQEASDLIKKRLEDDSPLLVTRFGSIELDCILNYFFFKNITIFNRFRNIIDGIPFKKKYDDAVKEKMNVNAGFFPISDKNLDMFSELILNELNNIDILGSWIYQEQYLFSYFNKNCNIIFLEDLPPFHHENPWSESLKGKKVLVVHPFKNTILSQYIKHDLLFKDKRVLPDFKLEVFQAVQTIGCENSNFDNWFDALTYMEDEIKKIDFDIAIVGCGAYGMPLASRIKKMKKKAIHLAGQTQCLFGIKGKRWEDKNSYNYSEKFYNQYWVRPSEDEKPDKFKNVEDGCYW